MFLKNETQQSTVSELDLNKIRTKIIWIKYEI